MNWSVKIEGWKDSADNQRYFILEEIQNLLRKYYKNQFIEEYPLVIGYKFSTKICSSTEDFPCTHIDRSMICLTAKSTSWCQLIFQMSHELCHCTTSRKNLPQAIKWFDEFLCCFTSYFVLKQFENNANIILRLYGNYPRVFTQYLTGQQKGHIYKNDNPAEFFSNHRLIYMLNENEIKKHDFYYLNFYEKLKNDFIGLSFIGKIHLINCDHIEKIEDLLSQLKIIATKDEIRVINIICDLFGLNLEIGKEELA